VTRKKHHAEEPPGGDAESATLPEASPEEAGPANPLEAETARLRAREEDLLRALAEMSNVQKRRKSETEAALRYANESLVLALLPALDDLDRALASTPAGPGAAGAPGTPGAPGIEDPIRAGVTLVRERLMSVLRREGLAPIHSKGAPFDPALHDAIAVAPAPPGVAPGTILEEASVGYRFKDRVLRHAKVVVADGPTGSAETESEEDAT